ncbi:MAG: hypothetical protein ACOYJW_01670 [Candidatus Omnitrophota bacterium]|jgi:DNA-binding Lrp family transcriptional regulator
MINENDLLLLSLLRQGVPFVNRPFDAIGEQMGLDGADVILQIERMRKEGYLSAIRPIWDHRFFGYQGAWAAMKFSEQSLEQKLEIIGQHPGVIYMAQRDHEVNGWFYITAPGGHDLEAHVRILEKKTEAEKTLFLPIQRILKGAGEMRVFAGGVPEQVNQTAGSIKRTGETKLTLQEIRLIRLLQEDFLLTDEPFRRMAETLAIPESAMLHLLQGLFQKGYLKRIGISGGSKPASQQNRFLVVWQIPEEKINFCAERFADFPSVISAGLRPAAPEFPYTVYTTVESKELETLELLILKIADKIGHWPNRVILTVREFRKTAIRYFPKELDAWWARWKTLADPAFI